MLYVCLINHQRWYFNVSCCYKFLFIPLYLEILHIKQYGNWLKYRCSWWSISKVDIKYEIFQTFTRQAWYNTVWCCWNYAIWFQQLLSLSLYQHCPIIWFYFSLYSKEWKYTHEFQLTKQLVILWFVLSVKWWKFFVFKIYQGIKMVVV